jgi:hypothetical protein
MKEKFTEEGLIKKIVYDINKKIIGEIKLPTPIESIIGSPEV